MHKHVWKLINAQRDILSAEAVKNVQKAADDLESSMRSGADTEALRGRMNALELAANKWLKPYPHAGFRENVEVLLVAIAVAMGIRTFIAQPFKIPTGSMQPTLYGVTSSPDHTRSSVATEDPALGPTFEIPSNWFVRKWLFWFRGIGFDHVVAKTDGVLDPNTQDVPKRFLLFNLYQDFAINGVSHRVWFPPDKMLHRAGLLRPGFEPQVFKAGEDVIRLKSISGDHLFVDRITYNFRRPQRGEIIVFDTSGIAEMPPDQQGQYYIKRLVALGDERVRIANDRHLVINGRRLDSTTPHFERVYSFGPEQPAMDSKFSGHVNEVMARRFGSLGQLAPKFPDENAEYTVPHGNYMVMGDNTMSSYDSRGWGSFPQENVIGRSWFVYWPIGRQEGRDKRFGGANR
jgi:signal peptidase I